MQLWNSCRIRKEKQELKRKAVLGIMLTLLFIGILSLTFDIQQVEAGGTIYIRADGSIWGTTDIMTFDNVTYTFTANINDSIVVERNNITIDGAGYTVQGTGSGTGIDLSYRNNVTLKNVEVTNFYYGIYLNSSSNNTLSGNTVSSNNYGGIYLFISSNNTVTGNNASTNESGIYLYSSSDNVLFHNNLIDNANNVEVYPGDIDAWDDGVEGNYWSDYTGVDLDHDGIGDTEHVIDANNTDNYPLMGMFSDFKATSENHVQTICNSTYLISNTMAPQ
jgi:parallel beta-helix repeat protein